MRDTERQLLDFALSYAPCPLCDNIVHRDDWQEHLDWHNEQFKPFKAWMDGRKEQRRAENG